MKTNPKFYTIKWNLSRLQNSTPQLLVNSYKKYNDFSVNSECVQNIDWLNPLNISDTCLTMYCEELSPEIGLILQNNLIEQIQRKYSLYSTTVDILLEGYSNLWSLILIKECSEKIDYLNSRFTNLLDNSLNLRFKEQHELKEYSMANNIFVTPTTICLYEPIDLFKSPYSINLLCSSKFKNEMSDILGEILLFEPFEKYEIKFT